MVDIDPLPAVTDPEDSGKTRRAAALRSHPQQCGARLSLWRRRQGRGRLRQRRARDKTRYRQHPRRGGGNGAARGDWLPTTRPASATRSRFRPRASPAIGTTLAKGILKVPNEKVHLLTGQCRRLVRHEEHQLSRICLHPACREGAGPAGEMDRRALDELSVRQPRPGAQDSLRARARCRRQVPRGQGFRPRQSRRLHHRRRAATALPQHRQEHRQRLPHAADDHRHQDRADQHHADGPLSRCRTARGQLFHGTADRSRRRRDGHQPADLAQAQFHQAGANAVQCVVRHGLRQRRFPGRVQQGARDLRPRQFRQAQEGEPEARQAARHRRRLLSRSHRASQRRTRQDRVRGRRLGPADHRHARLRPGPRDAVRAGALARSSAFPSRA